MPELRKERVSILLLLLRNDCCDFVTILERVLRLFHFIPHTVEKINSDNKNAQIVYNQVYQCLNGERSEHTLKSDCWDFVTIFDRDSVFSTL